IETVFSWPGIGRRLVQPVSVHDYPLAQGAFLMIALVLALMNFVADLLYMVLDPRVSHGRKSWGARGNCRAAGRRARMAPVAKRAAAARDAAARSVRLRGRADLHRLRG